MPTFMFNLIGILFTVVGAVWVEERFRRGDLHHLAGWSVSAEAAMPAFGVLTVGLLLLVGSAILHHLERIDRNTEFSARALAEISESEAIKTGSIAPRA